MSRQRFVFDYDLDFDFDPELDELERLSNSVVDLIHAERFRDARKACLELVLRYPDQIDGFERWALVHEALGEIDQAVRRLRQCLDFIDTHLAGFDAATRDWYRSRIEQLESRRS